VSALTLGLIAAVAWGFHDICVRFVSQTAPLMASLLTVLFAGTVFHLGLMAYGSDGIEMSAKAIGFAVLSGLFVLMASLGLYAAFQRGPVRLVAPIIASYPILSVGWAVLQGVDISALQWGAVLAIVAGVSLVAALADDGSGEMAPKGPTILYAIIAAIGFATTFAIGQWAVQISDEMSVTLVTRVTAIVALVGGMVVLGLRFWPGRRAIWILCLMGVADGIALICVLSAGTLPDAQYAAVAASTFGLLTIVMAWAILKERMTPAQWAGCCVAFAGIGILAL
jgi:drug/metabolite transporter (DMT)-like permease